MSRDADSLTSNSHTHLDSFVARSGRVRWSPSDFEDAVVPPEFVPALAAAAFIEGETGFEVAKVRSAGLLRRPDIAAFIPLWLAEEDEHARALTFALRAEPLAGRSSRRDSVLESARQRLSPVGGYLSRILPHNDVLFLGVGAGAEHVTKTLYRRIALRVEHPGLKRFLYRVAAQEARHMAFFRAAALFGSPPGPVEAAALRRMLVAGWRPVGMDRLGPKKWNDTFLPLLADDDSRRELQKMDRELDEIPLFRGLGLMGRFLDRSHQNCGWSTVDGEGGVAAWS